MACKKGFRRAIRCYGKRVKMRNALGKSLAKIFSQKKEHHLFSGDIGYRIFDELVRNSPSQFHNFGISEQHMVTFAASFAVRMESTSIVYTISPFITSRVHDQLRVDVAYRKAPLIICSVGAGFSYDSLGFTHFGIEDLGLIESLPNFQVFSPCQPTDVSNLIDKFFKRRKIENPVYLRLQKGGENNLTEIYLPREDNEKFKYWEGNEILIITHGAITEEALKTRQNLNKNISVGVISIIEWNKCTKLNLFKTFKKIIFLEENRFVGSFASKVLKNNTLLNKTNYKILCVEKADFDRNITRKYALDQNNLNHDKIEIEVINLKNEEIK